MQTTRGILEAPFFRRLHSPSLVTLDLVQRFLWREQEHPGEGAQVEKRVRGILQGSARLQDAGLSIFIGTQRGVSGHFVQQWEVRKVLERKKVLSRKWQKSILSAPHW